MPAHEAPCVELGSAPDLQSAAPSPSSSELSSNSSLDPPVIRPPPLFRVLALTPPEPEQPPGQEELERRLPGYRRIVIPRELTLIELLKQSSGVTTDDEVLRIREARLRVVAERVGLRRLHIFAPRLRSLTLDGSAIMSLRDLGIGLVRLRILSVNRCNLTSLDGIWGLASLRELHASGNRIEDLQPLAVLQKLHTLNLSNNPVTESSRLWTLGVCSSLRNLTLRGSPLSNSPDYRARIASVLHMLVYLDDHLLHNDIQYEGIDVFGEMSSSSESEPEDNSNDNRDDRLTTEPEPGPSTSNDYPSEVPPYTGPEGDVSLPSASSFTSRERVRVTRVRPATTECAVSSGRTMRPTLPPRPNTAHAHRPRAQPLTRLQIMHNLLGEDMRCSGSPLTSHGAVCGNLTQALRRPSQKRIYGLSPGQMELAEMTLSDATRALAAEIPHAPILEDWTKFKRETGIEIDIDFNERPKAGDPEKAIERLEQIELETKERLERETLAALEKSKSAIKPPSDTACPDEVEESIQSTDEVFSYNLDVWRHLDTLTTTIDDWREIEESFNNSISNQSNNIQ